MKKIIQLISLIIVCLIIGAYLQVPILSLFDGVYNAKETPKGLNITPDDASFIILLHNNAAWKMQATGDVFTDGRYYYAMYKNYDLPLYHVDNDEGDFYNFSYIAKTRGYKVDGVSGEIMTSTGSIKVPFTVNSVKELQKRFPIGTTKNDIIKELGSPYTSEEKKSDNFIWHKLIEVNETDSKIETQVAELSIDTYFSKECGECIFVYKKNTVDPTTGKMEFQLLSINKAEWERL